MCSPQNMSYVFFLHLSSVQHSLHGIVHPVYPPSLYTYTCIVNFNIHCIAASMHPCDTYCMHCFISNSNNPTFLQFFIIFLHELGTLTLPKQYKVNRCQVKATRHRLPGCRKSSLWSQFKHCLPLHYPNLAIIFRCGESCH